MPGQIIDMHDEDFHSYTVTNPDNTPVCRFEVDNVYSKDGAVWGEVSVFYLFDNPDDPTRIIAHKRVNMLTDKKPGIDDLADYAEIWPWDEFYEQVMQMTVDAHREPAKETILDHTNEAVESAAFLVEPFILNEGVSLLYGPGGTGKSLLALAFALSITSGKTVLGSRPMRSGPVVYIDYEDTQTVHERRLAALMEGLGMTETPEFPIVHVKPRQSIAKMRRDLRTYIRKYNPALVMVDSVGLGRGGDANGSEDTIRFFATLNKLGVPVLAVDHMTKDDVRGGKMMTPYGSVYTVNSVRLAWAVKAAEASQENVRYLNMVQTKRNNVAAHRPMGVTLDFLNRMQGFGPNGDIYQPVLERVGLTTGDQWWDDDQKTTSDKILDWITDHGDHTVAEIADGTKLAENAVRARLSEMMNESPPRTHSHGQKPRLWGLPREEES